jgi:hypothetical protein
MFCPKSFSTQIARIKNHARKIRKQNVSLSHCQSLDYASVDLNLGKNYREVIAKYKIKKPELLFTFELGTLLDNVLFRYQKNQSWRNVELGKEEIIDCDFTTYDVNQILMLQNSLPSHLEIEGKKFQIHPYEFGLFSNHILFFSSLVLRSTFPSVPGRDQLIEIIYSGNDKIYNILLLNIWGKFELRDYYNYSWPKFDPTRVVCFETFMAENGYVGPEAAEDEKFMDEIYNTSLMWWIDHLSTGFVGNLASHHPNGTIEQIMKQLKAVQDTWKPNF